MILTDFYTDLQERLEPVLPVFLGPANDLPTRDGSVEQSAVIWATPGETAHRANTRATHERRESFNIVCVGATALDALAAAQKVRGAINYWVPNKGAAPVTETGLAMSPTTEPGTDPIRVSLTLQFKTTTKEHHG